MEEEVLVPLGRQATWQCVPLWVLSLWQFVLKQTEDAYPFLAKGLAFLLHMEQIVGLFKAIQESAVLTMSTEILRLQYILWLKDLGKASTQFC